MRHIPRILWLAAAAVLVGLGPAAAQDLARERVELELTRTDERIRQAEMAVSQSDHDEARTLLGRAIDLQRAAWSDFRAGFLRTALDKTLRARLTASSVIALIRGTPDPDRVRRQLERTREVIDGARDRIEECDDERARAMLKAALEMQRRAESAFHSERYLAALQLTTSARERAFRALRACNVHENLREAAERALRRTDEVIARAQDHVGESGSERARRLLARAAELQERAHGEFRAERFEAALRLTQSARTFARRAMQVVAPGAGS